MVELLACTMLALLLGFCMGWAVNEMKHIRIKEYRNEIEEEEDA